MALNFPQAIVTFPGINRVESLSFAWSIGTQPSSASMEIVPQPFNSFASVGTLRLRYGGVDMQFQNCSVDSGSSTFNQSGEVTTLILRDFRWAWEFATITGLYNVRDKGGNIVTLAKKTDKDVVGYCKRNAKELAELCLKAMNVKKFKSSMVPQDQFPATEWDNDNASRELSNLLEDFDLRVAPQRNGSVNIVRSGVGATLPTDAIESMGVELDPPEVPKEIRVVAAPTRYNHDFELEAVGLDSDGTIRLIDDLTYAPDDWAAEMSKESSMTFLNELGARELAMKSVYRWFRIKKPDSIKGYKDSIKYIEQLLPLDDRQVNRRYDSDSKTWQSKSAIVYGKFWKENDLSGAADANTVADVATIKKNDVEVTTTGKNLIVPYSFSIDAERGIVTFSQQVNAMNGAAIALPELFLRTAVSIRDIATGAFRREEVKRKVNGKSIAKENVQVVEDVSVGFEQDGGSNESEIRKYLEGHAKEVAATYETQSSQSATYVGWVPFELDGAIRSVTWSMGAGGASTSVIRNSDRGTGKSLGYRLKQRATQIKDLLDKRSKNSLVKEWFRTHPFRA